MFRARLHLPHAVIRRSLALLVVALGVSSLTVPSAQADPLPDMMGYTRPGKDGSLPPPKEQGPIVGGVVESGAGVTVYYAVYDRFHGTVMDPWNTGLKNLTETFVPGKGAGPAVVSRGLDTEARYLYVYQIVNDSKRQAQVREANFRLLVEPEFITSWGHFAQLRGIAEEPALGVGFMVPFGNAGLRPLSVLHASVTDAIYRPLAPAFRAPQAYQLGLSPLGGTNRAGGELLVIEDVARIPEAVLLLPSMPFAPLAGVRGELAGGIALVDWLNPSTGPRAPAGPIVAGTGSGLFSQLGVVPGLAPSPVPALGVGGAVGVGAGVGGAVGVGITGRAGNLYPALQVNWLTTPLIPGQRSVLFGFTSNLPPTFDGVRVGACAVGVAGAAIVVDGTVPTPVGFAPEPPLVGLVPPPPPPPLPLMPPLAPPLPMPMPPAGERGGGGGFGGGTAGFGGGMGGGTGGGMSGGGFGGFGGGMGGGFGNGGGGNNVVPIPNQQAGEQQQQQQQQQPGQPGQPNQTININVNQNQNQHQNQHQHQHQNNIPGTPDVEVIPEPAAILAATLALPAFLLMARRRRKDATEETATTAV